MRLLLQKVHVPPGELGLRHVLQHGQVRQLVPEDLDLDSPVKASHNVAGNCSNLAAAAMSCSARTSSAGGKIAMPHASQTRKTKVTPAGPTFGPDCSFSTSVSHPPTRKGGIHYMFVTACCNSRTFVNIRSSQGFLSLPTLPPDIARFFWLGVAARSELSVASLTCFIGQTSCQTHFA